MSIEVYFINLALGTPVYFFLRWLLKRFIEVDHRRIQITWIATILLTPLLYISIGIIWILSISYYPSREFNRQQWLNDQEKRFELSKDLIESEVLLGKTKPEIRRLLGDEGNTGQGNHWSYYLGFRPQLLKIDPDVLIVEFRDGIVVRVEQHGT
ncbi:hypothetical protein [Parachryseolinea silvisoli]|uniref:hypothetical protein n=1 Tax=Parachryseolinea silvisoli TaxID=2873601 RepID=UPI002265BBA2|nr:hypothetical protein [Parachryseolinea silvisoli]MCD9016722.1 hypothetical protein [Parachryseolinea silvisoli]